MRAWRKFRPWSSPKGLSVAKRFVIGIGTLVAVTPVLPAHAEMVTVGFGYGTSTVGFGLGPVVSTAPACQVSVLAESNGIAVLDAAVAKGCLTSYKTTGRWNGYEGYVVAACLNEVCQVAHTVWGPCHLSYTVQAAWYHSAYKADLTREWGPGLEDFRASNGKGLAFIYGRSTPLGIIYGPSMTVPTNDAPEAAGNCGLTTQR